MRGLHTNKSRRDGRYWQNTENDQYRGVTKQATITTEDITIAKQATPTITTEHVIVQEVAKLDLMKITRTEEMQLQDNEAPVQVGQGQSFAHCPPKGAHRQASLYHIHQNQLHSQH
jgi:hypothetical protein